MNKKMFCASVIIALIAALLTQGCGKKSPTTPPNTTPVATIQIDDFEDMDYIDSVGDTVNDLWFGFSDGVSTNTVGLSGAPGGKYGYYCFAITSTVKATIFTVVLQPYFGFNGMMARTYTNFATSTGLNLSTYSFLAFGINVHVTASPTNGAKFKYGISLFNGAGDSLQFDFSQDIVNDRWIDCNLPLSYFTIPPIYGTGNFPGIISNVTEIDFYYFVVGNQNSTGSLEAQIDNVHFDKY